MSTVLTLAERHRLRIDAMRSALPALDAALAAYARAHAGRPFHPPWLERHRALTD